MSDGTRVTKAIFGVRQIRFRRSLVGPIFGVFGWSLVLIWLLSHTYLHYDLVSLILALVWLDIWSWTGGYFLARIPSRKENAQSKASLDEEVSETLASIVNRLDRFISSSEKLPDWMETTFSNDRANCRVRVDIQQD